MALVVAGVALLLLGPGRTCDLTPPCPTGAPCITLRIVGRCPITNGTLLIALISGAAVGTVVMLFSARRHG